MGSRGETRAEVEQDIADEATTLPRSRAPPETPSPSLNLERARGSDQHLKYSYLTIKLAQLDPEQRPRDYESG